MSTKFKVDSLHLDAESSLFFERELMAIERELYTTQYPALKLNELVSIKPGIPEGAQTYNWKSYDWVGMAKVVANYALDFPNVTVKAEEHISNIRRLGDSFSYSVDDIEAAKMAGFPLERELAAAAALGINQRQNYIGLMGDSDYNIPGFFSNANIPSAAAPADGNGGSTEFENKNPDQIIRDFGLLIDEIKTLTKGVENANTVALPISTMSLLRRTRLTDTVTLLKYLEATYTNVTKWVDLFELETAGVGGTKMGVAYDRSPRVLEQIIPLSFKVYPSTQKGLSWEFPCSSKTGGVVVRFPLACNFLYGL